MKLSIIIPVYNTENFLEKCLNSVINQTYDNLEIIIVNDGSTDRSKTIIENYAKADLRIIAIHQENGGIGSAYKTAFKIMSGDYISFVDSDDYLELNACAILVDTISREQQPDIVHFGRDLVDMEYKTISKLKTTLLKLNNTFDILKHHITAIEDPSLACRAFKKELFSNTTIFEQNIGIDEILIVQLLKKSQKAVFIDNYLYHTLVRQASVSRATVSDSKTIETLKVYQFIIAFLKSDAEEIKMYYYFKYFSVLFSFYKQVRFSNSKSLLKNNLKTEYRTYYKLVRESKIFKNYPLRYKMYCRLLSII